MARALRVAVSGHAVGARQAAQRAGDQRTCLQLGPLFHADDVGTAIGPRRRPADRREWQRERRRGQLRHGLFDLLGAAVAPGDAALAIAPAAHAQSQGHPVHRIAAVAPSPLPQRAEESGDGRHHPVWEAVAHANPHHQIKLSWLPPQLCFVWVVIYGLIAMQKNNDLLQMLLLMLLPVGGMTFAAVRFPESSVSPSEAKYITGCFVVQIAMAPGQLLVITGGTKNEASPEVKAVKRGTSFASALLLFVFGVITSLAIGILGHPQPASTASSL